MEADGTTLCRIPQANNNSIEKWNNDLLQLWVATATVEQAIYTMFSLLKKQKHAHQHCGI